MNTSVTAFCVIFIAWTVFSYSLADEGFDVRQHLSTVTRYGAVKDRIDNQFVPSDIPDQCTPIHLNLVARHGTRSPTKKRIRELDNLALRIKVLIRDAEERQLSLQKVPTWLQLWQSPWKGKLKGGELISKGEDELYDIGIRIRERFPDLFTEEYHPDVYPIKATQVPRASASAVAFGMGLFSNKGTLGPGHHRAFAVTSESRASDILLRFYESCENYKVYRENQEPAVNTLKEPVLDEITSSLTNQYELNFTRQDTASLWFLCKQEASLLDITDQACRLFSPSEVALLEWTDDLEVFILKGYGKSLNYRMGVPLLKDVVQSMDEAIKAKEENRTPGSYEKAKLRFAHAETVVPFSCLLGLFLEGPEFRKIQREEPLQLPPKPPQSRNWHGSTVAPFAGNNMLVLYSCPHNSSSTYFVQVLHNERSIPMPGCDNSDFCPFEAFKARIVAPHLKHDYNAVCTAKVEQEQQQHYSLTKGDLFDVAWITYEFGFGGQCFGGSEYVAREGVAVDGFKGVADDGDVGTGGVEGVVGDGGDGGDGVAAGGDVGAGFHKSGDVGAGVAAGDGGAAADEVMLNDDSDYSHEETFGDSTDYGSPDEDFKPPREAGKRTISTKPERSKMSSTSKSKGEAAKGATDKRTICVGITSFKNSRG